MHKYVASLLHISIVSPVCKVNAINCHHFFNCFHSHNALYKICCHCQLMPVIAKGVT